MTHINLNYKNKSLFLRQQLLGNTIRGPDLVMDSGSDPIPDAKSADFEYCGGQIETGPVWTDW